MFYQNGWINPGRIKIKDPGSGDRGILEGRWKEISRVTQLCSKPRLQMVWTERIEEKDPGEISSWKDKKETEKEQ